MGNNQTKQAEAVPGSGQYRPKYEVIRVIEDDPNYGRVKLVRDTVSKNQMILKEYTFDDKRTFDEECSFFKSRATFEHPNIVQVIGYNAEQSTTLCSSVYKVAVFIEVIAKELQTELKERMRTQTLYQENDLLYMAQNLISALSHLQKNNLTHGDIRPVNIFLQANTYKLTDPKLEVERNSNGLVKAIVNKTSTLLSPQLLRQVPMSKFENKFDPYKSDVFSLGITLLSMATLTEPEDLYDYELGNIDDMILEERLRLVQNRYSRFTYELIKDMLIIDEKRRPDFIILMNRISPYQDSIRGKIGISHIAKEYDRDEPAYAERENSDRGYVERGNFEISRMEPNREATKKAAAYPRPDYKSGGESPVQQNPPIYREGYDSGVPQQSGTGGQDLDARIKAALQKSQETYNKIGAFEMERNQRFSAGNGNYGPEREKRSAYPTQEFGYIDGPPSERYGEREQLSTIPLSHGAGMNLPGYQRSYYHDDDNAEQITPKLGGNPILTHQESFGRPKFDQGIPSQVNNEKVLRSSPTKKVYSTPFALGSDQNNYERNLASYNYELGRSSRGTSPVRELRRDNNEIFSFQQGPLNNQFEREKSSQNRYANDQTAYDRNLASYNYELGRSSRGTSPVREQKRDDNGVYSSLRFSNAEALPRENNWTSFEPTRKFENKGSFGLNGEFRRPEESERVVKSYNARNEGRIVGFFSPFKSEVTANNNNANFDDMFEKTGPIVYRASYGIGNSPSKDNAWNSGQKLRIVEEGNNSGSKYTFPSSVGGQGYNAPSGYARNY